MIQKRKCNYYCIIAFVISVTFFSIFIWRLEKMDLQIEKIRATNIADGHGKMIQRHMERALSITYAIAALIRQGNGSVNHFEEIAGEMLPFYPGVESVQLVPDGVVSRIYPLKGNEKAIGHDLLNDKNRVLEAVLARDTGKLTLAGPFYLLQGPLGAIGRLPVFLDKRQSKWVFWGFVAVVLSFPEVLDPDGLKKLKSEGFVYQLWRFHPDTGQKQIICKSSDKLVEPIECLVEVPNAQWTLSICPVNGWINYDKLIFRWLLGLVFSFLVAWVAKLLFELKEHKQKLEKIAYLDNLTGLSNRRLLIYQLHQLLAVAKRLNKLLAVCFLDLDGFKMVNDNLGHKAGDQLLIELAERLKKCLRAEDLLARLGGDEFIIVLTNLDKVENCLKIIERILQVTSQPFSYELKSSTVSASVGITIYPDDDSDVDTLLIHADKAMYHSKKHGKGRYSFFEPKI